MSTWDEFKANVRGAEKVLEYALNKHKDDKDIVLELQEEQQNLKEIDIDVEKKETITDAELVKMHQNLHVLCKRIKDYLQADVAEDFEILNADDFQYN